MQVHVGPSAMRGDPLSSSALRAAVGAVNAGESAPPAATSIERNRLRKVHRRDALLVAAAALLTWVLCGIFNMTEMLRRLTAPYERYQLDELPTVLLALGLGMMWFAMRRYGEARREIARRKSAETQLTAALADNRRLAQQYVELQEAERKTLARELHDELGQYLSVIKLDAVRIRDDRRSDLPTLQTRAAAIVENCNHVHSAVTTLIRELRPAGLDELGLEAALEHCVQTWRTRVPSVLLRLDVSGDLTALPEEIALTVYRLVQEALTNVAKHSAAKHADIHIDRAGVTARIEDCLSVAVADDGVGSNSAEPTCGLGLIGMRERVKALHGELAIASTPGCGYRLTARIPMESLIGADS